ncbi:MAG TPA: glycosyltransferase [Candidatus Onthousia faecigallinarum]|nr:glycosyltransferase [Candidatus Onthousia faecigallinarum]
MQKRMNQIISFIFIILFTLFFVQGISFERLFQGGRIFAFLFSFLFMIGVLIFYQLYLKANSRTLKKRKWLLLVVLLTLLIGVSAHIKLLTPQILGMILLQVASCFFICFYIMKDYEVEKGALAVIFFSIAELLFTLTFGLLETFAFFLSSFSLFCLCLIDRGAIYRKKNYLIMMMLGISMGICSSITSISLLFFLFIFLLTFRIRGMKSAIKLFVPATIFYFLTWFLSKDLFTSFQWSKNLYPVLTEAILVGITCIFLLGSIYSMLKAERKIGLVCRIFLILFLLWLWLFPSVSFAWYGIFCSTFLLLLLSIYDNLPKLYSLHVNIYRFKPKKNLVPTKRVTAVVPNYNYANYVLERIDSILFQTYPITELIILDDCSTDNSVEIIEKKVQKIKEQYPYLKVEFLPSKKNGGNVFRSWARCFEVSHEDYLWICEADDSASPRFLENVMKAFDDDKVVLSYSESLTMDENDVLLMPNLREWIDIYDTGKWNQSYVASGEEELRTTLCINNTIANVSSVVFRKQKNIDYQQYLKGAEEFKLAGDWYFYSKVLEHGDIAYCRKSLNYHRMHQKSVTLTTKNDRHYLEICRIQDMIMKEHKVPKKVKALVYDRRENVRRSFCLGKEELRLLDVPLESLIKTQKVKDEVLLSIIIPVYNTEPYLRKCLDSVVCSLPLRTEVIIVNDGSPDNSEEIIKEYCKKFSQIRAFKKKNGGLSSAKNFGLKEAKGKYIIYLDSDDYVSPNMYQTMLKLAIEQEADIVYCDIFEVFDDGSRIFMSMTNYDRKDPFMQIVDTPLMASSANKMLKKSLYGDLLYPEGKTNEDVAISPVLYLRAKKIVKADSPFYFYYQRSGSIQNSSFSSKRFVIFDTAKICFDHIKGCDPKKEKEIKGSIYTHQILGLLLFLIPHEKRKKRLKLISIFCEKLQTFDDFATNRYVLEYMEEYHLPKLISYLEKKEIKKIDMYLQIKMRWR